MEPNQNTPDRASHPKRSFALLGTQIRVSLLL
jgi:hypothetical protein